MKTEALKVEELRSKNEERIENWKKKMKEKEKHLQAQILEQMKFADHLQEEKEILNRLSKRMKERSDRLTKEEEEFQVRQKVRYSGAAGRLRPA